jgi:hypothetical protein
MQNAKQYFEEQLIKGYACTIVIYFIEDVLKHSIFSTANPSAFDDEFENYDFIHYRALGSIKNAIPMFIRRYNFENLP